MPNPMTGAGYGQDKDKDKDKDERLKKYITKAPKYTKSPVKSKAPVMKGKPNPKKQALQSMLGSLSSGANFRN